MVLQKIDNVTRFSVIIKCVEVKICHTLLLYVMIILICYLLRTRYLFAWYGSETVPPTVCAIV